MVTLGGVALNNHIIWVDRRRYSRNFETRRVAVGGGLRIWRQPRIGGRPITLEARIDQGWLTRAQVTALESLAASAEVAYTFNYHDAEVLTVQFTDNDGLGVDLGSVVEGMDAFEESGAPVPNGSAAEMYIGTIRLVEVVV